MRWTMDAFGYFNKKRIQNWKEKTATQTHKNLYKRSLVHILTIN